MDLVSGANDKARQLLADKATKDIYEAVVDAIRKDSEVVFATNFQNYVTRLGMILSECVKDGQPENNTYLGSIDFICGKVLESSQMRKLMKAIEVNELGNYGKHSLKNIHISIDECLHQYNNMIKAIVQTTGLDAFNVCYLAAAEQAPAKPEPTPVKEQKVEEKKPEEKKPEPKKKLSERLKQEPSHSFGCIAGVKYEFLFLEEYDVDPYFRKVRVNIDLMLPGSNRDKVLSVLFKSKRGKELDRLERIALNASDKYHFDVTLGENELVNDKAVVVVELWVEEVSRQGILRKAVYQEVARERIDLIRNLDE